MEELALTFKFGKESYNVKLPSTSTVSDLRKELAHLTRIPPEGQKFAGWPALIKAPDDATLGSLKLKSGKKLMLLGTPADVMDEFKDSDTKQLEIVDKENSEKHAERQKRLVAAIDLLKEALEERNGYALERAISGARAAARREKFEVPYCDLSLNAEESEMDQTITTLIHECREALEAAAEERRRRDEEYMEAEMERRRQAAEEQRREWIQQEEANEQDSEAVVSVTLPVFSARSMGVANLHNTDQICLPSSELQRFIDARIQTPYTLSIRKARQPTMEPMEEDEPDPQRPQTGEVSEQQVRGFYTSMAAGELPEDDDSSLLMQKYLSSVAHSGCVHFTAPDGLAYLPDNVMQKLGLSDSEMVTFETVELPKAEFVQIQPLQERWRFVPSSEALLEYELRKYTTLTLGDIISVRSPHDGRDYHFRLLQMMPAPAVSILNTDLMTDIAQPGEGLLNFEQMEKSGGEFVQRFLASNGANEGTELTGVELDTPQPISLSPGEKRSFVFSPVNIPYSPAAPGPASSSKPRKEKAICASLKIQQGDADIFISRGTDCPSIADHEWAKYSVGDKMVEVPRDSLKGGSLLYVTIDCFGKGQEWAKPCKAELTLSQVELGTADRTTGVLDSAVEEGSKRCPNCERCIPQASFALHEMQCAKRNLKCGECDKVLEVGLPWEKHQALVHTFMDCKCGAQRQPQELALHRLYECQYRLEPCLYCEMLLPEEERGEHQKECGSRSVKCQWCKEQMPRWKMKRHIPEAHPQYVHMGIGQAME